MKIYELEYNLFDEQKIKYSNLVTIQPTFALSALLEADWSDFKWSTMKSQVRRQNNLNDYLKRIFELLNIAMNKYKRKESNNIEYSNRIKIHSDIFKAVLGRNTYIKILKILENCNILKKCTEIKYLTGNYSSTYELSKSYINALDYSVVLLDDYDNDYESTNIDLDDKLNDLDKRFINTIKTIKLNKSEAIIAEFRHHNDEKTAISSLVNRLNNIINFGKDRFIKKGAKVERVYHSLTNLSRISRKYLSIKMYWIDITNSQPLLLAYYLRKNGKSVDSNYVHDVENGKFYKRFTHLFNNDRNITKKEIYRNIFFAFKENKDINKLFNQLYPEVWTELKIINDAKSKSKVTLASILQNIESEIFQPIPSILQNSEFMFTLHDSIYFDNKKDLKDVEDYLLTTFKKFGLNVTLNSD